MCEVGGDVGGGGGEGQEMVEAEAEAEIRELRRQKEEMEARQRRREEERERLAREREEMGATWGMGECFTSQQSPVLPEGTWVVEGSIYALFSAEFSAIICSSFLYQPLYTANDSSHVQA